MIIPSIDLMNGKVVQLENGKTKKIELDDPIEIANKYSVYGEIAVIDLDSAMGKGDNSELIKKICKIAKCRVGGGIRTIERANEYLDAGANKIIIGTCATKEFLSKLPKERVIVAIDSKDNKVVTEGWEKTTMKTPKESVKELKQMCSGFLYTDVLNEGLMKCFNLNSIKDFYSGIQLTVAGGISSIEEIKILDKLGLDVQLGMSIYTGKINLVEAFCSLLDFEKQNGLIPTIVQDNQRNVLMLAYSTKESLALALNKKMGIYFSRSRNAIWEKGLTSGNYQEIISVNFDCDKDTLLFTIYQKGNACHKEIYSCFGDKVFNINDLYSLVLERKSILEESFLSIKDNNSYTLKLLKDDNLLKRKIIEEAGEVVTFENKDNLVWEIADLTYFLLVLMAKNDITPEDILNKLSTRRK
jgi:phosphoribosyl-AMP cyclohydrolase / phosphoribosyl-ATP pyrophosphohydrolase